MFYIDFENKNEKKEEVKWYKIPGNFDYISILFKYVYYLVFKIQKYVSCIYFNTYIMIT